MKTRHLVELAISATLFFTIAGVGRLLFTMGSSFLFFAYIVSTALLLIIMWCISHRDINAKSKAMLVGAGFGLVLHVVITQMSMSREVYDLRLATVEKEFLRFQEEGCRVEQVGNNVHIYKFGTSSGSESTALVISTSGVSSGKRFVSERDYIIVELSSRRHGITWLFKILERSVYVWELRSATCIK